MCPLIDIFQSIAGKVIRSIQWQEYGVEFETEKVNILAYADDVDLIDRNLDGIKEVFTSFKETAHRMGGKGGL